MTDAPLLIYARDALNRGEWPRLRNDHRRGRMTRIWPGAYAETDAWSRLGLDARRLLRIEAARRDDSTRVYCDESAGALWGMPLVDVDHDVVVSVASSGGGRSSGDLRKRATVVERSVQQHGELLVTTPAQTVSDLARRLPFRSGLAVADWTLAQGLATIAELDEANERMRRCHGFTRAARVIRHASPKAESPLESVSRAGMLDLGIDEPVLQPEVVDVHGRTRRADFGWPRLGLLGECDGRGKYERSEWTRGRSPAEVVWEEKQREDALRAVGHDMARWGWREAMALPLLARILGAKGLHPRHRRQSPRAG